MRTSLSYLGYDLQQLPPLGTYENDAVESVLFSRIHLEDEPWQATWNNLVVAIDQYNPDNVVFHFPMNESDYTDDPFVYDRLLEGYRRAADLGISGVVVHSNRIRTAAEWQGFDAAAERNRIGETLANILESDASGTTWLGLENMPSVGNYGLETDPLFTCTADFEGLPENLGIVWDVCHALSSLQYLQAFQRGELPKELHLRPDAVDFTGIEVLGERVVHWHFASSKGLNLLTDEQACTEGVLPTEGDLPEEVYAHQLRVIEAIGGTAAVNFEVQEDDYGQRVRGPIVIAWAKRVIETLQADFGNYG